MTIRVVAQLSFVEGVNNADRQRTVEVLSGSSIEASGILAMHAGLHTEGSVGGGDLTWDVLLPDESRVRSLFDDASRATSEVVGVMEGLAAELVAIAPMIASIDAGVPQTISAHLGQPNLTGIKRTLWLRVLPGTDPEALARFEAETPLLAAAVPAIRNWRWSRLSDDLRLPREKNAWTHLWEQDFETLGGLEVDYMSSPCHWGYIDRWFDPEMPDHIVDVGLAHLACPATAPVLSWDDSD
jgi:hypothetical protein